MTSEFKNVSAARNFKAALNMYQNGASYQKVFCKKDNLEESMFTLSEELESLNISPVFMDGTEFDSVESLKELSINLTNALWKLIHKYRMLMKSHSELNDAYARISNENTNSKNHVKRLKEELQKKEITLSQVEERERKLKVQCVNVTRDLKHEKNEVVKLKKQSISKDTQHEHEIRRIMQNGHKLREQLQKSMVNHAPKDRTLQKVQADHAKEVTIYKQKICRLEEDNRVMREEINELKDTLALHSAGIELQIEASGIWNEAET